MEEKYKKASQLKLRYHTVQGDLAVEDLWALKLEGLDAIAQGINRQLKLSAEESFIRKRSAASAELQLKLDILVDVINTKQEEADANKVKAAKKAELATLKDILAQKSHEKLLGLSPEELEKRIADLEKE